MPTQVLKKGMKLFKKGDKGGKGLPDEILAVLQRLLPGVGAAVVVGGAPLYAPPPRSLTRATGPSPTLDPP